MLVQKQSPGQQALLSSETQAEQVRSMQTTQKGEGVVDGTRSLERWVSQGRSCRGVRLPEPK